MKKNNLTKLNKTIVLCLALVQMMIVVLALPTVGFAAAVLLNWDPSPDADLAGYNVYYQAGSSALPFSGTGATEGNAPINAANTTSTTVAGLDPGSSYYFAVTAYNTAGVESVYSNVIEIPESVPPVVRISYPSNNESVNGSVTVAASASDNVGVVSVQFYVDGVLQATDTAAPYVFTWNTSSLTNGAYSLSAKAFDAAGNEGQSANVAVTVAGDTTPPAVSLTAPGNNASVSGRVTVTASASDNVAVTNIEIYDNGALVFASNVSPAAYNWNSVLAANGIHTLSAKAYDAAGNIGQSTNLIVSVLNDFSAPSVILESPANGSTVGGVVSVAANAMDDIGVTKVEFYLDGAILGAATSAPYSFNWNTVLLPNGAYTLNAKAYDAVGKIGQSANVTVNVFNDAIAPTVSSFSIPGTTNSTAVAVSSFSATDNVGVTGYLIGYSGPCRPAFRSDAARRSGGMPTGIP